MRRFRPPLRAGLGYPFRSDHEGERRGAWPFHLGFSAWDVSLALGYLAANKGFLPSPDVPEKDPFRNTVRGWSQNRKLASFP